MVANPYYCHTVFAPAGVYTAGHMLEVILAKRDTLWYAGDYLAYVR